MCSSAPLLLPWFVFHHLVQATASYKGWIMRCNLVYSSGSVTHPLFPSASLNVYQHALIHTYVSSIPLVTLSLQSSLLFKEHTQCWTHTAVAFLFHCPSEWPWGPQVKKSDIWQANRSPLLASVFWLLLLSIENFAQLRSLVRDVKVAFVICLDCYTLKRLVTFSMFYINFDFLI